MIPLSQRLFDAGKARAIAFCEINDLPIPKMEVVPKEKWHVHACAYYRPQIIRVCLEECGRPCSETMSRNWSWPGSDTDREPYGVVCHELGHHVDWLSSEKDRGPYYSRYSTLVRKESGEDFVSGYQTNSAEWFAEHMRVFITNAMLLGLLRPRTFDILIERWTPVSGDDWEMELREVIQGVPDRIVKNLRKKIGKVSHAKR